jgi:ankyrin repeat protein
VIDFLVKQVAKTLAINKKSHSPADLFWRLVLSSGFSEETYGRLVSHFTNDTTFIEEGGFTIIHRILFGQSKADLDQTLQDMPHLVDVQDAYGQSPRHWAATRGDVQSTIVLLKHGAQVDIVEKGGSTPLL